MEILYFNSLNSTQKYLIDNIKNKTLKTPICVISDIQTDGIGSRDNLWISEDGNFFASFAINIDGLPDDLQLSSASIYFAYIMKQILCEIDKNVYLKWPNDLYIDSNKIGGVITKKIDNILICGIGINLKKTKNFDGLRDYISPKNLLKRYISRLEKFPKWKHIFREFEIEFDLNRKFYTHIENEKKSLKDAILSSDGSLIIEGKRVFSLR